VTTRRPSVLADAAGICCSLLQRAYRKIDALLAQGPDNWGLTRDEMAAIHLYTDDGLGGPAGCLFRPLNAALRVCERADAKPYWGYIRLLQHALFKLPKDKSGVLYRGIKWNWPGAPPLPQLKAELQRLAATGEATAPEHDIWWGFSSTSTSLPAVETFLGQAGPRVIFTLDPGSSARDVRRYSAFQAGQPVPEDERLLPCGTAFAVKTVGSPAPDLLLVGLRQTNDILIQGGAAAEVSRAFQSASRTILTEIYLCHVCSYQEIMRRRHRSPRACQEWSRSRRQGRSSTWPPRKQPWTPS
jgi:hypothetical protein